MAYFNVNSDNNLFLVNRLKNLVKSEITQNWTAIFSTITICHLTDNSWNTRENISMNKNSLWLVDRTFRVRHRLFSGTDFKQSSRIKFKICDFRPVKFSFPKKATTFETIFRKIFDDETLQFWSQKRETLHPSLKSSILSCKRYVIR